MVRTGLPCSDSATMRLERLEIRWSVTAKRERGRQDATAGKQAAAAVAIAAKDRSTDPEAYRLFLQPESLYSLSICVSMSGRYTYSSQSPDFTSSIATEDRASAESSVATRSSRICCVRRT